MPARLPVAAVILLTLAIMSVNLLVVGRCNRLHPLQARPLA